ncbi:hypothetical protein [Aureimonas sp. ME7]|uniref:hypothetical protein n=1 Tax=Aureimonas sp. ME7 TaxID=2744252 RepID=UPI0015FC623A|nr:hypothetical protein [Aureimonas sp. ME7]
MPNTAATGGASLTTQLTTVVANTAADAKVRTYEIALSNIKTYATDSAPDPQVPQCLLIDASASNVSRPILPTNVIVRRRDAISRRVVLDPGDSLQISASEASAIYAHVQKIFEEPA